MTMCTQSSRVTTIVFACYCRSPGQVNGRTEFSRIGAQVNGWRTEFSRISRIGAQITENPPPGYASAETNMLS